MIIKFLLILSFLFQLLTFSQNVFAYAFAPTSPNPLVFGDVAVGSTSSTQTITLTNNVPASAVFTSANPGELPLGSCSLGDTSNYTMVNDTCSNTTLTNQGTCQFGVSFSPQSVQHTVTFIKCDIINATIQNQTSLLHFVTIDGNGIAPQVAVTPQIPASALAAFDEPTLAFGDQVVGSSTNNKRVLVENTGTATMNITNITANSPFSIVSNGCGSSLAAHTNCALEIAFTPTTAGGATGDLTVTSDANNNPQAISLTGTGVTAAQPHGSISIALLSFNNQLINTTSAEDTFTLKNTGSTTLNITSITMDSSQFNLSDDCGNTLGVNASCTLTVDFSPTSTGDKTATIEIVDDSSHSPQTISLTGKGIEDQTPKAILNSSTIDFGAVVEGQTSDEQSYTITNIGNEDLVITDIKITGDEASHFSKLSNCIRTLTPGSSCTGTIRFHPDSDTSVSSYSATIEFTDNSSDSPQQIALSGSVTFLSSLTGGGCSLAKNKILAEPIQFGVFFIASLLAVVFISTRIKHMTK